MVAHSHPVPAAGGAAKEERSRAITIKDVAKAAGVHFTTVSLALRDHKSLPDSTKTYIRGVADRLGYVRNPIFSALTHFHLNGRVRADPPRLGYLINQPLERGAALCRQQSHVLDGAREQARMLGYELEVILAGEKLTGAALEEKLRERNIAGLVIAGFDPGAPGVVLPWERFSVVKINSMHMEPSAPVVSSDHRQDVRLACQRLRALGYQRIGLAVGRADEDATESLYTAGYLLEQSALAPRDRVPELLFPYECTLAEAGRKLAVWAREHRVDAVVCNWSAVDELLRRAGLRVPEEIACASLCLLEHDGGLAGVCPNPKVVGAKAISHLTTLLKSGERGVPLFASRTYVRSYWQEGDSAPAKR